MLYLVRHGRTAANASGLLQGRIDLDLDDVGRAQAAATAARLAPVVERGTEVFSSPLARARQTAAIVAPDAEVVIDDRWIELDYGDLDGTPLVEVPGDLWVKWRSDASYVPSGGESLQALGQRVRAACEEWAPRCAAGADVVVVTHVSPLKAAVCWALGVPDEVAWRMFVAPASVTLIDWRPGGPSLVGFNEQPWAG